jgi:hypothetical protein
LGAKRFCSRWFIDGRALPCLVQRLTDVIRQALRH